MSKERSSRSWSRPRSMDGADKRNKRRSVDLRRSIDERRPRDRNIDDKHYQRFVLTDPVAFKYLEDDPSVTVLETRKEIQGYQCYIVEQWATSRTNPTFVITTPAGDHSDKIVASILGIPKDEAGWSQRLKIYFAALNHFHARRRDTPDGIMMITSLPGFPSFLTILFVPDGDVRKHYAAFFVNEDLKRLGCSGRVGMNLAPPNNATAAKYHQLYRTSDKVPLTVSVIELVRMCQTALHMFDMLDAEFVDGLLCDVTEKAVVNWWASVGSEFHQGEPHDSVLGPHTVAALMGVYLGARRRLHFLNVPVPKDSFEVADMKRGIASFQKSNKLHRTRRLDKPTLLKLHDLTRKVASADGWHLPVPHLPHAVKTTVAEISGRGEELLAEGQIKKGKAGIRDIESADIDSLPQLVSGQTSKWLWQGKSPKRSAGGGPSDVTFEGLFASHKVPRRDTAAPASRKATLSAVERPSLDSQKPRRNGDPRRSFEEAPGRQRNLSHLDSAARRVQDGVGKVRDVITVHKRPTEDDRLAKGAKSTGVETDTEHVGPPKRPPAPRSYTSPVGSPSSLTPSRASDTAGKGSASPFHTPVDSDVPEEDLDREGSQIRQASINLNAALQSPEVTKRQGQENSPRQKTNGPGKDAQSPEAQSPDCAADDDTALAPSTNGKAATSQLSRRRSASSIPEKQTDTSWLEGRLSRQLSFSVATSSMSAALGPSAPVFNLIDSDVDGLYVRQRFYAQALRKVQGKITALSSREAPWTSSEIDRLEELVQEADEAHNVLRDRLENPTQEAEHIRELGESILDDEMNMVDEGRRELETLAAKLDYEIAGLKGKIEDVEVGVDEFERSVELAEGRVNETERDIHKGGSWSCIVS